VLSDKEKEILHLANIVGGGKRNEAGATDDTHSVIAGGIDNLCALGSKSTISGGKQNSIASEELQEFDTISGGWNNQITDSSYSVITGGGGVYPEDPDEQEHNKIRDSDKSTISGGKENRISGGAVNTISGGFNNWILADNYGVITGGNQNLIVQGYGSPVIVGGARNYAGGLNSLAFGKEAVAGFDHSMVVNLMDGTLLEAKKEGQFLMNANSFTFQIGNGKGKGGRVASSTLTKQNIGYLRTALEEEE